MRRALSWTLVLAGVVVVAIVLVGRQRPQGEATAQAASKDRQAVETPPAAAQTAAAGEGGVAYTFGDDAALEQFANFWQQRQGILTRIRVLQAYLAEEQALLKELHDTLATTYHLDPDKEYMFDASRRALIERPSASPPAAPDSTP